MPLGLVVVDGSPNKPLELVIVDNERMWLSKYGRKNIDFGLYIFISTCTSL